MYSAGSIYWLPPKEQICSDHLLTTDLLEDGCFNHPVVILATDSSHKEAALLIITSLKGQNLLERFPRARDKKLRAAHVPIHPSSVHPDNGSCFFLADGEQLEKNSYVKLKPTRVVKTVVLKPWRRGKCRLKTKCLRELLKQIDFQSPWPNDVQHHKPALLPQPAIPWPPVHHQSPVHYQIPVQHHQPGPWQNQRPRAITCGSSYQMPGQWVATQDLDIPVHSPHQRTPLLPRTHNIIGAPVNAAPEPSSVNAVFALIFVSIMVWVGYRWYVGMT